MFHLIRTKIVHCSHVLPDQDEISVENLTNTICTKLQIICSCIFAANTISKFPDNHEEFYSRTSYTIFASTNKNKSFGRAFVNNIMCNLSGIQNQKLHMSAMCFSPQKMNIPKRRPAAKNRSETI